MKRFVAFAVLALGAGMNSPAMPPAEKDLLGEYWDEWNIDRFEFIPDSKAVWTTWGKNSVVKGVRSFPDESTLKFVPDEERHAGGTWTCVFDGGLLFLKDKNGVEKTYRRETREQRRTRAAAVFIEIANLAKARLAILDDTTTGLFRKKEAELQARLDGLVASFGGEPKTERDEVARYAKMKQPGILDDIAVTVKRAQEGALKETCRDNLKKVGVFYREYVAKYKKFPEKLLHLKKPDLAKDDRIFICPVSGKADAFDYVYPAKGDQTPADTVLAYDHDPHSDGSRSVMTFSGAVVELDKDRFEVALKKGVDAAK